MWELMGDKCEHAKQKKKKGLTAVKQQLLEPEYQNLQVLK